MRRDVLKRFLLAWDIIADFRVVGPSNLHGGIADLRRQLCTWNIWLVCQDWDST
jgi:hypothetical protein